MNNDIQATANDTELDHERYMRLAIEQAHNVPQLPFGAVIVDIRSGEVLAEGYNRSAASPTFHGEIDAINRLAAKGPRDDWAPLALYTTAEPCPMCQGAIEWAGIGLVVYGTSIATLQELGWWQIDIRAEEVIRRTPFRETRLIPVCWPASATRSFAPFPAANSATRATIHVSSPLAIRSSTAFSPLRAARVARKSSERLTWPFARAMTTSCHRALLNSPRSERSRLANGPSHGCLAADLGRVATP